MSQFWKKLGVRGDALGSDGGLERISTLPCLLEFQESGWVYRVLKCEDKDDSHRLFQDTAPLRDRGREFPERIKPCSSL